MQQRGLGRTFLAGEISHPKALSPCGLIISLSPFPRSGEPWYLWSDIDHSFHFVAVNRMNIDDGFDYFKGFFKKDFTYLFLDRGEKREKERRRERERNINVWLPLVRPPHPPGPGLQPGHVS